MIGRSGERGSGISVVAARDDDDDDDAFLTFIYLQTVKWFKVESFITKFISYSLMSFASR